MLIIFVSVLCDCVSPSTDITYFEFCCKGNNMMAYFKILKHIFVDWHIHCKQNSALTQSGCARRYAHPSTQKRPCNESFS